MGDSLHTKKSRTNTKHPIYRGIRCRSGKWVSEIREPGKSTRIWLGTYPIPQMAAAAYDVALLALKGTQNVVLNFPSHVDYYPKLPPSPSRDDIRRAAATAVEAMGRECDDNDRLSESKEGGVNTCNDQGGLVESSSTENYVVEIRSTQRIEEYVDGEALFEFPSLLVNMAEAMMLSPPRLNSTSFEDYSYFDAESLWSYY